MKRISFLFLSLVTMAFFSSCVKHESRCTIEANPLLYIYKFKSGSDYSNQASHYMYRPGIDDRAFRDILGCRPMPLHDGYYTGGNIWYAPPEYAAYKTAYLTITLDEVEGNDSIYNEWRYHWENYILDDDPFQEFYVYKGDCDGKSRIPRADSAIAGYDYYHHEYESQIFDSSTLNDIIDNHQLEKYCFKIK